MFLVVLVVSIALALWWRSVLRGKVFVRSVDFMMKLDNGLSIEEANRAAHFLLTKYSDPDTDGRAIHRASAIADAQFGGKQLPLIALAKSKGFRVQRP